MYSPFIFVERKTVNFKGKKEKELKKCKMQRERERERVCLRGKFGVWKDRKKEKEKKKMRKDDLCN